MAKKRDRKQDNEHDHHWKAPEGSHGKRPKRRLDDPDVFFTLKVYSQAKSSGRSHRSLKFTVDFNAPFQANTEDLEPYYISVHDQKNVHLFRQILEHIAEVYDYISDPTNYNYRSDKGKVLPSNDKDRIRQQAHLKRILKLTKGRINHIFYEQGSASRVGVGTVALTDGNGDMRPPRII